MEWDPLYNFKWPANANAEGFQPNFASSPQTFQNEASWSDLRWQDQSRGTHPDPCLPPVSFQQIGSTSHASISPPSLEQSSTSSSRNLFPDTESNDHDSDDGDGSDHEESLSPRSPKEKRKLTRGSRACTVCRRLKLRCVGAQDGKPCRKCAISNQECIFPESKRGKSSKRTQEELAASVKNMERTLAAVINSINDPALSSLISGMASCPPSPKQESDLSPSAFPPPTPISPASQLSGTEISTPAYLPADTLNPLGLLAETSLAHGKDAKAVYESLPQTPASTDALGELHARFTSPGMGQKVGVANEGYFKPGPMTLLPVRRLFIEHQVQPEMLNFVTTEEVISMFQIYFEHVNPLACLLVPDLQTPSYVCARSPFLLTTICAIASRFSEPLRKHHRTLTKLARKLAFDVPSKGYKSIEIVQAYLLLTLWGYGATCKYEHDTTWLLLGLAIRMATDLNLHRPSPAVPVTTPEGAQATIEIRNRERTWVMCFILDRSISAQLGKPHTIQENYLIRNVSTWWQHPVAAPLDAGLAAYAELQRIVTRCLEMLYSDTATTTGLQMECNYLVAVRATENQLLALTEEWAVYIDNYCASSPDDSQVAYWKIITEFYNTYSVLLLNSLGLQDAIDRSPVNLPHFFSRCLKAATDCARCIKDDLGPRGYLRYSPLSHFIQGSYAVLTLLKLSRPEFKALLNCQEDCLSLANAVIEQLESASIDSEHNPGLFATFLRRAVENRLAEENDNPETASGDMSHESIFHLNGRFVQDDFSSLSEMNCEPPASLE